MSKQNFDTNKIVLPALAFMALLILVNGFLLISTRRQALYRGQEFRLAVYDREKVALGIEGQINKGRFQRFAPFFAEMEKKTQELKKLGEKLERLKKAGKKTARAEKTLETKRKSYSAEMEDLYRKMELYREQKSKELSEGMLKVAREKYQEKGYVMLLSKEHDFFRIGGPVGLSLFYIPSSYNLREMDDVTEELLKIIKELAAQEEESSAKEQESNTSEA